MAIQKQDLDRLMNECEVQLPGATRAGIRGVLFNVIDEFMTDSNSWNEWIPLVLAANTQNYLVTPAQGGQIKRLGQVIDQNCVIYPAVITSLQPPAANLFFVWPQNITINVNVIVYKSVVLPNQHGDIPDAPNWLLPQYERVIEAGVVGRMQMHKAKSYSDSTNGPINVRRFRDGIAMARTAALRGYIYGGQAWRFPRQFRTNSQRGGVSTPFPQPTSWGV
jgi:hypothetical protein